MPRKIKIIIGTAAVIIAAASFFIFRFLHAHTSDAHLSVVPGNAAVVLKLNIRQLALKSEPEKLLQLPVLKGKTKSSTNDILAQLSSDPFATGIDPVENVYAFMAGSANGTAEAIVFNIDDAGKLAAFIRSLSPSQQIQQTDDVYVLQFDPSHCLAWNDDAGILLSVNGSGAQETALSYLQEPGERSICTNDAFKTFGAKSFDAGLFINNKQLSLLSGSANSLSPLGISDGYGEVLLSFENDKLTAVYNNHRQTAALPVLKQNGPGTQHNSAIAPKDPLVYAGLAIDMKMLFAALKNDQGMSDNIKSIEIETGMTESEMTSLFTGDISFAATDFKDIATYDPRVAASVKEDLAANKDRAEAEDYSLYVPVVYISVGETDDDKLMRLLENLGLQKMNDVYAVPGLNIIMYFTAKNGHLLVTNDYYAADSLSRSGMFSGKLPSTLPAGKPLLLWADLDQSHFPPALADTAHSPADEYAPFLQKIKPFTSITLSGNTDTLELQATVAPGEGNSLYRLIAYYASMN